MRTVFDRQNQRLHIMLFFQQANPFKENIHVHCACANTKTATYTVFVNATLYIDFSFSYHAP